MNRTPVQIAIPLLLALGELSRPLALLGAVAVSLGVAGALAIVFPSNDEFTRGGQVRLESLVRSALGVVGTIVWVFAVLPSGNVAVEFVEVTVFLFGLLLFGRPVRYSSSRREFLVQNVRMLGGIGVLVALLYGGPLVDAFRANEAGKSLFPWRPPRRRGSSFDIAGLTPELTPTGQFYVMDEDLAHPDIDLASWRLDIGGLVKRPFSLRFDDMLNMHRQDRLITQECVSNPVGGPLMSTALFSGVPVRSLLARAGPSFGARAVLFRAPDGHDEALPLSLALDSSVMLVYAMDGRLLEQAHGFPVRLLVPGFYGYKSVKWVTEMRVTDNPDQGYWAREGWSPLPPVKTTARIDVVRRAPGGTLVAGIAFAGRRGIGGVQVRANGGPWHDAELNLPALSPFTWVQWRLIIPRRGNLVVEARAVDGRGRIQTAVRRGQKPDGASGYDSKQVSV